MMESIIINKKPYSCVMCFDNINNLINRQQIKATYPKEGKFWSGKYFFLEKLTLLEKFLIKNNKTKKNEIKHQCHLCSEKNLDNIYYIYKNIIWFDSLKHYVEKHNIKPPSKFIRFILNNDPTNDSKCQNSYVKLNGTLKKIDKFSYVKIRANQLMILDALMEHGGIKPKYKEKHESSFRYSEHAGVLEFNNNILERVIISGTTQRSDEEDVEIFLPTMGKMAYDYEYIFHTHPATPKPGGRAQENIMYEFPSIDDIYHFIEHFNNGKVQGSIVITPEGMYNIRKKSFDKKKIQYDLSMGSNLLKLMSKVQHNIIGKYGINFNKTYFYSVIAQDTSSIDEINKLLNTYQIHIDYFPRQKTKKGDWILGTIYLPICMSS